MASLFPNHISVWTQITQIYFQKVWTWKVWTRGLCIDWTVPITSASPFCHQVHFDTLMHPDLILWYTLIHFDTSVFLWSGHRLASTSLRGGEMIEWSANSISDKKDYLAGLKIQWRIIFCNGRLSPILGNIINYVRKWYGTRVWPSCQSYKILTQSQMSMAVTSCALWLIITQCLYYPVAIFSLKYKKITESNHLKMLRTENITRKFGLYISRIL